MNKTATVIADMLKENTGRALCDSGGAYGRNWEHNQDRSFEDDLPTTLCYDYDYIAVQHSLYHWLNERLEYAEDLDAEFHKWAEATEERKDTGWLQLMDEFVAELSGATGLYGEGDPITVNTYNGEDLLSQVIQYIYFEIDDDSYVILQIHGGCDVRGGYTAPRIFTANGMYDDTAIFDNARAFISCDHDDEPHLWDTDDGHHWYDNGYPSHVSQLEDYKVTKAEDGETWTIGKLHVREDGSLQCPECGSNLEACA